MTGRSRAPEPGALLCGVALIAAIAEFGQVWFYPASETSAEVTRAFGGAFRLSLWLATSAGILWHLLRHGPRPLASVLGPFLPFLAWGIVVAFVWSIDPVTGLRTLTFWLLAAGIAVAAASAVDPRTLARSLAFTFLAIVVASLAVALFDPRSAMTAYGDAAMVRGLFPHKNAFGWFCALGLVWTLGTRRLVGVLPTTIATMTLAGGLLASGSKTAAAMLPAVAIYALAVGGCRRAFADGGRAALGLMLATAAAALVAVAAAPLLIDGIGRDATLTGRTDVWRHYLAFLHDRPLTGYGTGILSTDTEFNRAIGAGVPGYEAQALHSPHSLYIGLASETGLVGLACFLAAQGWLAFVAPFRSPGPWPSLAGALAVAILFAGVTEMRDGFLPGTATLLLIAARTMSFRAPRRSSSEPP